MPPSVRSFNQAAPFWDFVSSLQDHAALHSSFSPDPAASREAGPEACEYPWGPQAWGFGGRRGGHHGPGRGGRGRQHGHHAPHEHGPHGHHPSHEHGHHPPPPPHEHGHHGPPPSHEHGHHPPPPSHDHCHEGGPSNEFDLPIRGSGPPMPDRGAGSPPPPHDRRRSRSPPRGGRHGCHRGGHHFGHRGPRGGYEGFRGMGGPFGMADLADFFQSQIFGDKSTEKKATSNEDFTPPVDVFDTETAYVVHVSLAGARKEDVAVSWDAENSELTISGVIYRPGDEEFLKTLALDERNIGAFERKVKLGSRTYPAKVEVTGITAKMEDGVLRVHVPREDKDDDFVNITKVDID